jgi:hypothetical protein
VLLPRLPALVKGAEGLPRHDRRCRGVERLLRAVFVWAWSLLSQGGLEGDFFTSKVVRLCVWSSLNRTFVTYYLYREWGSSYSIWRMTWRDFCNEVVLCLQTRVSTTEEYEEAHANPVPCSSLASSRSSCSHGSGGASLSFPSEEVVQQQER